MTKISSYAEFERRLKDALAHIDDVAREMPEREILSIQKQLYALDQWTSHGAKPTQDQKDSLNFGLLASRYLDDVDQPLAQELYSIASFVTYW